MLVLIFFKENPLRIPEDNTIVAQRFFDSLSDSKPSLELQKTSYVTQRKNKKNLSSFNEHYVGGPSRTLVNSTVVCYL